MKDSTVFWLESLLLMIIAAGVPARPSGAASSPGPEFAARQVFVDGVPVVRLTDAVRKMEVSILPSIGNTAYEMTVRGKNILFFPDAKFADLAKNPMQLGIPFMAPWANRLDASTFWANGKPYHLNMELGNVFKDNHGLPIHGLAPIRWQWRVADIRSDGESAHVTSKFEFWKYPDLMAQWPFAHEYEMTYRLSEGALEVKTTVSNLSLEAMPLAIGFHPYYRIPDVPRDQWALHMPGAKAVVADERTIPTGEFRPVDLPNPLPLAGRTLDNGFADFDRDAEGRAGFSIAAADKQIEILFGPGYPVAVIWLPAPPPGQTGAFICIEPMAGITNAINLNHAGKYSGLERVPGNGKWTASFWVRPKGF